MGYVPYPPPSPRYATPTFLGEPVCFCEYCGNSLHTDDAGRCCGCGATPDWRDVAHAEAVKRKQSDGMMRPLIVKPLPNPGVNLLR